jgi:hypothetical protein
MHSCPVPLDESIVDASAMRLYSRLYHLQNNIKQKTNLNWFFLVLNSF